MLFGSFLSVRNLDFSIGERHFDSALGQWQTPCGISICAAPTRKRINPPPSAALLSEPVILRPRNHHPRVTQPNYKIRIVGTEENEAHMATETIITLVASLLAAAIMLGSSFLSFVNDRLKEATTSEERQRTTSLAWIYFATFFGIIAAVLFVLGFFC